MADLAPDVNSTFGVLFIGFILGVTLYGLTFFQTYVFYSRFPNERLWMKCTVGLLWTMDTITTALISHMQYFYLISSFLAPWNRLPVTKTFMVEKGLASLAIFVVQFYYAIRVYCITGKNHYIGATVALLALASLVLGVVAAIQLSHRELISALVTPSMRIVIGLNEALATVCDVVILIALHYCLNASRHPEMKTKSDLFERVVIVTINRGTAVTITQIVLLITFVAMPHSQVWIFFHFIISKCYINALFSMLNSRRSSHGRGVNEEGDVVKAELKAASPRQAKNDRLEFTTGRQRGMTLELGPVTSRSELGHLDVRRPSSMDSETLRSPVSPISMKAPSFGPGA